MFYGEMTKYEFSKLILVKHFCSIRLKSSKYDKSVSYCIVGFVAKVLECKSGQTHLFVDIPNKNTWIVGPITIDVSESEESWIWRTLSIRNIKAELSITNTELRHSVLSFILLIIIILSVCWCRVHICCLVIPSVVHANSVVMMSSMVSYGKVRPEILVILIIVKTIT